MYKDIKIILTTKHKKEEAIRKTFADHFTAEVNVLVDYDTDKYGTFTGEMQRIGNSFETVLRKAKDAMDYYDYQYAIANEGSFGPHPLYYFIPADTELYQFKALNCIQCDYVEIKPRDDEITHANPEHCLYCNP